MGLVGTLAGQQQHPRVLPALLGLGLLGSAAVVVWTFARPQALPASPLLVVPPILLLIAGQVGVAARLRVARADRGRALSSLLLSSLSSARGVALALVAAAGLLASWSGLALAPGGTPSAARPGCPYPLVSRGHVVCVDPEHYRLARLGNERFAAGVVLLLLAVDLAVAISPIERPAVR